MKITITVEEAPEEFDPHYMLRNVARDIGYGLKRLHSIEIIETAACIVGQPHEQDKDSPFPDF